MTSTHVQRVSKSFRLLLPALLLTLLCGACGTAPKPEPNAPGQSQNTSTSARSLFLRGEEQAQIGDNLRAEQYLLAAQRAGYAEELVLPVLLKVCVSSGRLRAALSHAEPYLRRHPEHHVLRHLVGSVYFGLGDSARAFRELQMVVTTAPHYAPAQYLLAVIADESFADLPLAEQHFHAYLKLSPHGPHAPEAVTWLREYAQATQTAPDEATKGQRVFMKGKRL